MAGWWRYSRPCLRTRFNRAPSSSCCTSPNFASRQGSTAPRRADFAVSPGFSTGQGSTELGGGLHGVLPGQSSMEDELEEVRHDDWVSMVDEYGRRTGACLPARFTGGCIHYGRRFWRLSRGWRYTSSQGSTAVDVPVIMLSVELEPVQFIDSGGFSFREQWRCFGFQVWTWKNSTHGLRPLSYRTGQMGLQLRPVRSIGRLPVVGTESGTDYWKVYSSASAR